MLRTSPRSLHVANVNAVPRGGTMTGTNANSTFLPGQRSGEYSVRSPATGHSYSAAEEAFVIFSGASFTGDGILSATR